MVSIRSFCPTWTAPSVTALDVGFFQAHGRRGVILDLDNTLVPWRSVEIPPEVAEWVALMRAAGLKLCLLSNTHRPGRLQRLAAGLGIPSVPGSSKPRRPGFTRAMALLELPAEEIAVVGDQVMTDIWGGNRCGMMTVLVERLTEREFAGTRWVNRRIERLLLDRMRRQGLLKEIARDG